MSITLTPEQEAALNGLLKFKKRVQSLGGYAGTGKTTVIAELQKKLKNYAVCAFTGKAANVLRRKGLDASTIHSLIYETEKDAFGKVVLYNGVPNWILKPKMEFEGFIVDEASMVGKDINRDLQYFGLPIIYVGDHGQLEPVGEAVNLMANPDFVLETIHRNAGEIAFFAEHIRKGRSSTSWDSGKKVQFVSKYDAWLSFLDADQIICAYNATRVQINKLVRKLFKRELENYPEVEDKIMCLRNNRQAGLFNGMQGIVTKIHSRPKNKFTFDSDDHEYDIVFDPKQFNADKYDFSSDRDEPDPFDFAYCITAHKSQGDEWPVVMVLEQICKRWDHKRWAYTVASRAKEKLIWAPNY